MKKQIILLSTSLLAILAICFGQTNHVQNAAGNETAIIQSEKAAWEAYKNKNADAFKKLMATDYHGVYAEGIQTLEKEVADMAKADLQEYSLADVKVVFPRSDVAVVTYKVTTKGTFNGQDRSGGYNAGSVYIERGGRWLGVFHTEIKAQ
ncbi:MAG: nuclear transport factor 2 family protein [Alphaproteobacteria bacterium]